MALYRIDGFDYWPVMNGAFDSAGTLTRAVSAADGWYDDLTQITTYTGRFGTGLCMGSRGGSFGTAQVEAIGKRFESGETCVIGQAVFAPREQTSWFCIGVVDAKGIGTGNSYNNRHWWINFEVDGVIRLYIGGNSTTDPSGATLVATTYAKAFHTGEWNYIEVKHKLHATAGIVEVRVNTVVVISYVGRTANKFTPLLSLPIGWDGLIYAGTAANAIYMIDDRYILDDTGVNNTTYLGNVRVNTQLTSAAGDLTEMSVSGAAANWDAVNEAILTEAEYVYSSLVGARDLYTMNPNVTAQNIFGVQVTGAFRQDDSTQMKAHNLIKTHATLYESTVDQFLAQNYHYYRDFYELNPFTGVGWTAAELNAVQAGQKLLAG